MEIFLVKKAFGWFLMLSPVIFFLTAPLVAAYQVGKFAEAFALVGAIVGIAVAFGFLVFAGRCLLED